DGKVIATKLDGKSIEVDPGLHTFRFTHEGAPPLEEKLLVREGERSRLVSASWARPAANAPAAPPPAPGTAPFQRTLYPQETSRVPGERPIPATVWIAGGAGLVFTGAFVVLGLNGNSKKSSLTTSCSPFCSDSDVSGVRTRYILADVSLGLGLVSFVTAAV